MILLLMTLALARADTDTLITEGYLALTEIERSLCYDGPIYPLEVSWFRGSIFSKVISYHEPGSTHVYLNTKYVTTPCEVASSLAWNFAHFEAERSVWFVEPKEAWWGQLKEQAHFYEEQAGRCCHASEEY